jgi:acetyltransferase-like isoleucine patch superfamily enzyme
VNGAVTLARRSIGKHVFIAPNAIVMGGVKIGDESGIYYGPLPG